MFMSTTMNTIIWTAFWKGIVFGFISKVPLYLIVYNVLYKLNYFEMWHSCTKWAGCVWICISYTYTYMYIHVLHGRSKEAFLVSVCRQWMIFWPVSLALQSSAMLYNTVDTYTCAHLFELTLTLVQTRKH